MKNPQHASQIVKACELPEENVTRILSTQIAFLQKCDPSKLDEEIIGELAGSLSILARQVYLAKPKKRGVLFREVRK